jgi:transcriptional regulator with XRE-family HTH domain
MVCAQPSFAHLEKSLHLAWQRSDEPFINCVRSRARPHQTLATAAGFDLDLTEAIERGEYDPPFDVFVALAEGLGITKATLVKRAEEISRRMGSGSRARQAREEKVDACL